MTSAFRGLTFPNKAAHAVGTPPRQLTVVLNANMPAGTCFLKVVEARAQNCRSSRGKPVQRELQSKNQFARIEHVTEQELSKSDAVLLEAIEVLANKHSAVWCRQKTLQSGAKIVSNGRVSCNLGSLKHQMLVQKKVDHD